MKAIDVLLKLDWFANVGRPIDSEDKSIVTVTNWREAIASCSDSTWETVCTEAGNDLTMHLNRFCKSEFQDWNSVVNRAKCELAESWRRMRSALKSEGLPDVVAACVEWDTIHAVAREHYAAWSPPMFFERILTIYQSGHFPCGWLGPWPDGKVRIF